jgi:hypothetical protein
MPVSLTSILGPHRLPQGGRPGLELRSSPGFRKIAGKRAVLVSLTSILGPHRLPQGERAALEQSSSPVFRKVAESRKTFSEKRAETKKFCHRLCPRAPPVAELSPSRLRFRPPIVLTLAFRLRPSRSASTYSRPVLDAGRTLRADRGSFKGGRGRTVAKLSLFATFSFFHISTAIRAACG